MRTSLIYQKLSLLLCCSFFLLACPPIDDEPAPDIPPTASFSLNFEEFLNDGTGKTTDIEESGPNHAFAATGVVIWNTILSVNLIVPVTAFRASFQHSPQYNEAEETWSWSYSFQANSITHTAELKAFITGDLVNWAMHISKEGSYNNFQWFTGTSSLNNNSGTWRLNANPQNPTPFLAIDWIHNGDQATKVTYTSIVPNDEGNGSYITYGLTGNSDFDVFYNLYGAKEDNLIEIEWNRTLKAGRVKNPLHFGDEVWHCWDSLLQDIDC